MANAKLRPGELTRHRELSLGGPCSATDYFFRLPRTVFPRRQHFSVARVCLTIFRLHIACLTPTMTENEKAEKRKQFHIK